MKKIRSLLLVLIMVFSLTGCVKYNINMNVNKDKSVDFEMIYALQSSMTNSLESISEDDEYDLAEEESSNEVDIDEYKYLEDQGFKIEAFEEDASAGVKISKKFKNIDDISSTEKKEIDINKMFTKEENTKNEFIFFIKKGNKYIADLIFDFSSEDDDTDYSSYQSYFDMKYTVTLPKKTISNNADEVSEDGKTLTWNLKYGSKNEVKYEFTFDNSNNMLYIICGIVALLIIIAIIVKKGNNKNNTIVNKTIEQNELVVQQKEQEINTEINQETKIEQ